jgi:dTDP-4-amino-4,6-dideoxygalactose transaminase
MSNICAGIALAQMERLTKILSNKKRIAERYDQALNGLMAFELAPRAAPNVSNHWMYCAQLPSEKLALSLILYMGQKRIQVRQFWRSLTSEPAFSSFLRSRVENSRAISGRVVALPCGSGLTLVEQENVIEEVSNWHFSIEGRRS